jgi:DHA1 family multidrug resistance protein-like MFS transporter
MKGVLDRGTVVLLISLGSISFALMVLSPILSLYIKSLSADEAHLATLAGAVISVSALTSSASAPLIGRLGDKVGQKVVLLGCAIGMATIHIPQAFVTSPMQLLVLRAIQGVFMGGTMPTANALLARSTAPDRRGTVFGLSTSIQAGGRAAAPMIGAGVANLWGMSPVFLVTAGILALVATLVATMVHVEKPLVATQAVSDQAPAGSA